MGNEWGGDDHDCVMPHIVMMTAVVVFVRLIDNDNSGDGGENDECNDGGGDMMILLISMDGDNKVNIIFINILKIGLNKTKQYINIFTADLD